VNPAEATDGISIRTAGDRDIPGILALVADRIGTEDVAEAELALSDAGFDRRRWSVAVDGSRIVSTAATFPMTLRYGLVTIPASQIEFVATDRRYERRGLVRRQFDYHHRDLARRGELFQVMVGITYFYRRLGYEYALPVHDRRTVPAAALPAAGDGWSFREAVPDDLALLDRLQAPVRSAADVAVRFADQLSGLVIRSPLYQTVVAEFRETPAAVGRLYVDGDTAYVLDLAAGDRSGVTAILAEMSRRASGADVTLLERPGLRLHTDDLGTVRPTGDAYYARIGDPVRFMNAARPEFERRLRESPLAGASGDAMVSLYTSSIRFGFDRGSLTEFSAGPGEQAPISKGGSGIAPDHLVSVLVGDEGFAGLAARHPDVKGGRQTELMEALFPAQTSDVQSWVVP
jgi:hypothetical protein